MARYNEYKESGQQWLGKVPSHWKLLPGKALFLENKHKNTHNSVREVLSLSYGKIIRKKNIDEGLVPENYCGYQIVEPNDIIIRCTDLQNDKMSLRTGFVENFGIISGAYLGLKCISSNLPKYLHYYLHTWDITKELYRYGGGLRQSLSWKDIKYLSILVPPTDEQAGIVAYLDKVTADIDKAIAAKERIISALEERRKIIITEAVTRGINPDAPLRDSGIDWLGKIPAHWECTKLKYLIRIKSGEAISNSKLSDTGEYPVYGGGEPLGMFDKFNVTPGMILLGRVGARCGCVTLLESNSWATDNALVISPINISVHYLNYILIAADLNKFSTSNAQPLLTGTKVKNIVIALPSPKEQCEIIDYISNKLSKVNSSISQQRKAIDLLRERKSIIINEVVTGKVKVV